MSEFGTPPPGSVRVIPFGGNDWTFEYPRLDDRIYELFHAALDEFDKGNYPHAEREIRVILEGCPEFIDAYHHLAIMLDGTNRDAQAGKLWKTAAAIGKAAIPKDFKPGRHRLPWAVLENRPFLRAYQGWGLRLLDDGEAKEALAVFTEILKFNPNDNQGIRVMKIECHFALGQPEKVLAVCNRFRGDGLAAVQYGRGLALYQLGRIPEAIEALREAVEDKPYVAKELVKKTHRLPRDINPGFVTMGGKDEAFYYWEEQGEYWLETPGAIALVAEVMKKTKRGSSKQS